MSAPLILATRPAAGSARLAARLEGLGYRALAAPCLAVERTGQLAPADLAAPGLAAIAFTSAEAVRAAAADLGQTRPPDLPVFCVGAATAEAAIAAGWPAPVVAGGDGPALEAALIAALPPGAAVLHLAGRDLAHDLAPGLAAAGLRLTRRELYQTIAADRLAAAAAAALAGGAVAGAILLSARTAAAFRRLAPGEPRLVAFCNSARTAAPLMDWSGVETAIAETPSLEAVIEMLQRRLPIAR